MVAHNGGGNKGATVKLSHKEQKKILDLLERLLETYEPLGDAIAGGDRLDVLVATIDLRNAFKKLDSALPPSPKPPPTSEPDSN